MKARVNFFGGQGIGWALDEDLVRARVALGDGVEVGSFAGSGIVLSAWWPPVVRMGRRALEGKVVVCFADNPPAFYLTRPGFEEAAGRVDLWIARSGEAFGQFRELGLEAKLVPYAVDAEIFRPLGAVERGEIRGELGFEDGDFVIGNFHRDSLGADLRFPKAQKGADVFAEIAAVAAAKIPNLRVLLAGPRRHWLRGELARRGVRCLFRGAEVVGDDFGVNVLGRRELNRLYAALDVAVISSRWEGGPYSVLEAIFAGRPVISTRVGMASDLLGPWLYDSVDEAVALLAKIAGGGFEIRGIRQRAGYSHSSVSLGGALAEALLPMSRDSPGWVEVGRSFWWSGWSRAHAGFRGALPQHDGVAEAMRWVREGERGRLSVVDCAIKIADAERLEVRG